MLLPDPSLAFAEVMRILKPGGVFAFSIWGSPTKASLFTILPQARHNVIPSIPIAESPNFDLGRDLEKLKSDLNALGAEQIVHWSVVRVRVVRGRWLDVSGGHNLS